MKLYEHEAKTIFASYGVPIPYGELVASSKRAQGIAIKLHKAVVVKAQVLVSGRSKAGGIKFADTPQKAKEAADKLLGARIKEEKVTELLIEERLAINRELYFGLTVDRGRRCFVAVASDAGGIDIEQVAEIQPQRIFKTYIEPQLGFQIFHARETASKMGYHSTQMLELAGLLEKLYRISVDYDAELVEANPLAETADGKFAAADARIIIDDNALFRHVDFQQKRLLEPRDLNAKEFEGLKKGLEYVKLDGNVGVVGNGAGLVMSTLDLINFYGGKPANFLDMGGGAPFERIEAALRLVLLDSQVKVLFVNILGGITLCDEVAKSVLRAREELQTSTPLVIRLVGTNENEGKRILAEANVPAFESMEEAAQKAVELAGRRP